MAVHTFQVLLGIVLNTWEQQNSPNNVALHGITWGVPEGSPEPQGIFVAVGEHDGVDAYIVTSTDGRTWTERSNPSRQQLNDVVFGGGQFVAVGATGSFSPTEDAVILTSPDGVTWTERSNPKKGLNLLGVAYGVPSSSPTQGIYVAVGLSRNFLGLQEDAYIITSPDGITWTERSNPKGLDLFDVIWAEELGLFVAVGDNALGSPSDDTYILTSPDGVTWTERANPGNVRLNAVAWNPAFNLLVAVGDHDGTDALILRSPDGITWTESQHERSPNTPALKDIIWDGNVFVAVGSIICTSGDGLRWIVRPSLQASSFGLNCVAYSGREHVAAGGAAGSPTGAYILRSIAVS